MPTLRQLRALALLAHNLSFTRTANQLAVTQSAVSVMVRELESELGATILVRGRTPRLTTAGEQMAECASRCLEDIKGTVEAIRSGADLRGGRLHLAVAHVSAATFVPNALARFHALYPQVTVKMTDCPVERVSHLVSTGEADVGIGAVDADPSMIALLEATLLVRDRLWAVQQANTTAAETKQRKRSMRWRQLEDVPLVLVGRVRGQWRDLFLRLTEAGIRFHVAQEVTLYPTAVEMVHCGLGTALLPGFVARRLDRRQFAAIPLTDPVTDWQVHWLTRHGAASNPAGEELRQIVMASLTDELRLVG